MNLIKKHSITGFQKDLKVFWILFVNMVFLKIMLKAEIAGLLFITTKEFTLSRASAQLFAHHLFLTVPLPHPLPARPPPPYRSFCLLTLRYIEWV